MIRGDKHAEGGMRVNSMVGASQSAVGNPARRLHVIFAAIFSGWPNILAFSIMSACALGASWAAQAGSSYLAVWSSDNETDDKPGVLNTDFLAIIDADPQSRTYGKVVNTAPLESVPGANLLNDLGLTELLGLTPKYGLPPTGIPSDALNEAHHMTHDPIVVGGYSYLFLGGLISANVFRCDVTDPLHVPTCPLVTTAKDVANFSGVDDFLQAPNGDVLVTYTVSNTGARSPGEELMTCNTSAVAVCCSNASRVSVKSRAFSIAITACAAKFSSSAISFSENGRTSSRLAEMWPSSLPSLRNGTIRVVRKPAAVIACPGVRLSCEATAITSGICT